MKKIRLVVVLLIALLAVSCAKKKQTDEEATAKIQENFSRQEQQIATMQKRLDIQKKYHGKLCLVGGWDWDHHIPENWPDFDEEEIRQGVRDSIDKYGPQGGYAFGGGVPGMMDAARRVNEIVRDEVHWYGRKVMGYVD